MRQIRPLWGLFISLSFLCLVPGARADWQYTRWGMTPQQVIDASGGQAVQNDEAVTSDDPIELLRAPYRADRFKFIAGFYFDQSSQTLTKVDLVLVNPLQAQDLYRALMAKYGVPFKGTTTKYHAAITWRDETNNNFVEFIKLNDYITVQYKPLRSKINEGL